MTTTILVILVVALTTGIIIFVKHEIMIARCKHCAAKNGIDCPLTKEVKDDSLESKERRLLTGLPMIDKPTDNNNGRQ